MISKRFSIGYLIVTTLLLGANGSDLVAQGLAGQSLIGRIPARANGIGVDQKLGAPLPIDLAFQDEKGQPCRLADVIDGRKPTLLTLNYSGCPGLCVAQLDGMVVGVEGLKEFSLGKDFNLLSISIDPQETAEKAEGTKKRYTQGLDARHDKDAWHFWTGTPTSIAKIADTVGFRYTYDKEHDRYNHAAMAVAISPTGKITRYLFDVAFEPATMKMVLLEASEGTIGSSLDTFLLWCMHYDESENRYSADARKLLSLAAGVFVLIVIGSVAPFWLTKKSPKEFPATSNQPELNPDSQVPENLALKVDHLPLEEETTV